MHRVSVERKRTREGVVVPNLLLERKKKGDALMQPTYVSANKTGDPVLPRVIKEKI